MSNLRIGAELYTPPEVAERISRATIKAELRAVAGLGRTDPSPRHAHQTPLGRALLRMLAAKRVPPPAGEPPCERPESARTLSASMLLADISVLEAYDDGARNDWERPWPTSPRRARADFDIIAASLAGRGICLTYYESEQRPRSIGVHIHAEDPAAARLDFEMDKTPSPLPI